MQQGRGDAGWEGGVRGDTVHSNLNYVVFLFCFRASRGMGGDGGDNVPGHVDYAKFLLFCVRAAAGGGGMGG